VILVPGLDEILDLCAEGPVERVLLEDVARRGLGRFIGLRGDGGLSALCHVGANGMRDLFRLLLRRVPRVCLFVRPENTAAIRVYDAVGMRRVFTYRSIIF
jgi:hypothetical protein